MSQSMDFSKNRAGERVSKRLLLNGVSKTFGGVTALQPMTLDVHPGELLALLGPSGCGKTTTLRLIAGFDTPDTGSVRIGEQDVTSLPPNKRGLGMVFQNYSLFPHLSVKANIGFGLKMAGIEKAQIDQRVSRMLAMVRLPDMGERHIAQLSGGQQQRIALARALITNPSVLLLDEPLGALDKNLREGMQFELRELQSEWGITSVMVTHDQEEALTMSDRVAVMDRGQILQIGRPDDVYERPRSRFVAEFLGTANIVECRITERYTDALKLQPMHQGEASASASPLVTEAGVAGPGGNGGKVLVTQLVIPLMPSAGSSHGASTAENRSRSGQDIETAFDRAQDRVSFAIRPEKIIINGPEPHHHRFSGRITQHVFRGAQHAYRIDVPLLGRTVVVYELAQASGSAPGAGGGARAVGADVIISFSPENAVILAPEDEEAHEPAAAPEVWHGEAGDERNVRETRAA